MTKLELVKKFYNNIVYFVDELDDESIDIIYHLCIHGFIKDDKEINGMCANYIGLYFKHVQELENAIKYYQMAINKGNIYAMGNIGRIYEKQEDYDNMFKFYQMAIDGGNIYAMSYLAEHYCNQRDHENAMKYYQMAIDNGNNYALLPLGNYYGKIKDHKNMIKCYLEGYHKGISDVKLLLNKRLDHNDQITNHVLKMYQNIQWKKDRLIMMDAQILKLKE